MFEWFVSIQVSNSFVKDIYHFILECFQQMNTIVIFLNVFDELIWYRSLDTNHWNVFSIHWIFASGKMKRIIWNWSCALIKSFLIVQQLFNLLWKNALSLYFVLKIKKISKKSFKKIFMKCFYSLVNFINDTRHITHILMTSNKSFDHEL